MSLVKSCASCPRLFTLTVCSDGWSDCIGCGTIRCAGSFVRKPAAAARRQSSQEAMGDGKHMQLQHAGAVDSQSCQMSGPFDVVLMDMTLSHLLHALLQVRTCASHFFCLFHIPDFLFGQQLYALNELRLLYSLYTCATLGVLERDRSVGKILISLTV